jgi:hypothetical protein
MATKDEKRNPFALRTETVRHDDWPDGFEVVVRQIPYGEKQRLDGLLVADVQLTGDQLGSPDAALAGMTLTPAALTQAQNETLLAGIESWTFAFEDGSPAPLDVDTVLALPGEYVEFIQAAIERLNPTRDEDFLGGGGSDAGTGEGAS